jgi:hypothetical protein
MRFCQTLAKGKTRAAGGFANAWQNRAKFAKHWQNVLRAPGMPRRALVFSTTRA